MENKRKAKQRQLKKDGLGDNTDTDDEISEINTDCDEAEAIVVPCLLCKVSTAEDQIQDNMFLQVYIDIHKSAYFKNKKTFIEIMYFNVD